MGKLADVASSERCHLGFCFFPLKTESLSDTQSLFAGRLKASCKQEPGKEKETSLPRLVPGQALGAGLCVWFLHFITILQKMMKEQRLSPLRRVVAWVWLERVPHEAQVSRGQSLVWVCKRQPDL